MPRKPRYVDANFAPLFLNTTACEQIKFMPTAQDVVKVVRCKDCYYYETGKDYTPYCNHINGLDEVKDNDYCSYGERKKR